MQNEIPGDQRNTELEAALQTLLDVIDRGFDDIKRDMDRLLGRDGGDR